MYDFFYLFKGKKKNFISLYPNWWFCFPASKTHKLILLCPWAGCWSGTAWEGKLHFLYNFTPKLIANTPHQLLESPCLHLQPQERIPGTHNIPESSWGCRDAQTKVSGWPELSSLGWNSYRVRGVLKNRRNLQAKLVFLWSLCAAVLMDCLIFPKWGQLFSQISFITIYPS